ncbi:unnamed protein product [Larinioides sclopetarius]|uniref:Uncharacterized protein n=1 Tax=Larinioides sclopetarius TaxID=280406 RepID=A0AAV2BTZ2_9ARAC
MVEGFSHFKNEQIPCENLFFFPFSFFFSVRSKGIFHRLSITLDRSRRRKAGIRFEANILNKNPFVT